MKENDATPERRDNKSESSDRERRERLKNYLQKIRSLVPRRQDGTLQDSVSAVRHFIKVMKAQKRGDTEGTVQTSGTMNRHRGDGDTHLTDLSASAASSNCCFIVTADKYVVQKITHRLAGLLGHPQSVMFGQSVLSVIHTDDATEVSDQLDMFVSEFSKTTPTNKAAKFCNLLFRLKVRKASYGVQFVYQPFVAKAYVCKLRPLGELMDSITDLSTPSVSDEGDMASSSSSSQQGHLHHVHERMGSWAPRPEAPPPWKGKGSKGKSTKKSSAAKQAAAAVDPDELLTKVTDEDKEEEAPNKSSPFRVPIPPITKPARLPKIKDMCVVLKCAPVQSAYTKPLQRPEKGTFSARHTTQCIYDNVEPSCVSILGYMPAEMIGTSIFCYYRPEDLPMLFGVYQQVVQTPGKMVCCQPYGLRARNGEYIVVDTEWSSYTNPWTGKLEFIICKHIVLQGPRNTNVFMEPSAAETQCNVEFADKIRGLLLRPFIPRTRRVYPHRKLRHKTVRHNVAKEEMPSPSTSQEIQDACEKSEEGAEGAVTKATGGKEEEGSSGGASMHGCDTVLKDQNISLLYHGLSYTQNIKRYLLTCGSDTTNDLQSMSESTSELEGMDVSLPLPHLESCASSTKALVSEIEPREEILSPHHEPEALLHEFDPDLGLDLPQDTPKPEGESSMGGEGLQKQPCKTLVMTEENLKNHQKNEMKLYIERMIQEKASLILTQYHSRLKRSHNPGSDHRPAKYQIMTSAGDGNFPRPPTVAECSPASPAPVGPRAAGFPYGKMMCGGYTYMPYPLKSDHQAAMPAAASWKRTLDLLPVESSTHRHSWAYRHKNKRMFKNSTTSSESSGVSWLTGSSSNHHQQMQQIDLKCDASKVMRDPFWRESISWSEELELRYSCPLRMVTTKGMRSSLRKLTTPKLIKRQLEEIAQNDTDSTPNMSASPEQKNTDEASSGGRESPPANSNSNASVSGESDSNSNEKSENGSGESNSLISASCTSGENSSSMKESDDMSHENEIETGSKSDKMFIPVKKSHTIGKAPFWVQTISQSGIGFQPGGTLFESNAPGASRPMFVISHQPEGVLQQLQELIAEMHCFNSSDLSSSDSEGKKDYDFVSDVKASMPPEKNNESSAMGDSGFGTSCNGNGSSTKQGSSCSNVSGGDSGSEKKDLDGCGNSISSDKDLGSGNEVEPKEPGFDSGKSDDTILDMDSYQMAQDYDRLVGDLDAAIKSKVHCEEKRKIRDRKDRDLLAGKTVLDACQCERNLPEIPPLRIQLMEPMNPKGHNAQHNRNELTEALLKPGTSRTNEAQRAETFSEEKSSASPLSDETPPTSEDAQEGKDRMKNQSTESETQDSKSQPSEQSSKSSEPSPGDHELTLSEARRTEPQRSDTQQQFGSSEHPNVRLTDITEDHGNQDEGENMSVSSSSENGKPESDRKSGEDQYDAENAENMSVETNSDSGKQMSLENDSKSREENLDLEDREDMSVTNSSDDGKKNQEDSMSFGSENSGSGKKHEDESPDAEKSRKEMISPNKSDSDFVILSMENGANQPMPYDVSDLHNAYPYGHRSSDILEPVTESDINEYWSLLFTHSDDFISLLYM